MRGPGLAGLVILLIGSLLGGVGVSHADTGVLQVVVAGALSSPTGVTGDGKITVRLGRDLPVSLVSGGAVVTGVVGTGTFARWTDTTPTTGFGPEATLIVIRLGGEFLLMAAGIDTSGGSVTTFSGTPPAGQLSGTWTLTGGAGVAGAGAGDAIVTFTYDTGNAITGAVDLVAKGVFPISGLPVAGIGTVFPSRNAPVHSVIDTPPDVAADSVGGPIGVRTSYEILTSFTEPYESVQVAAMAFDGLYIVYGCTSRSGEFTRPCLVGAGDPFGKLSATMRERSGSQTIEGVLPTDLVMTLVPSQP